ncbi:hypothetical protein GQ43DRAFT_472988 [Delitschia confertaspora ATCC 74209]|uniref:Uncharacterized protein n=1 Tax=Delitschia confertaspora ATCC 74209 TaxID=1513339 RepID=A0A9P4JN44_9PLEO|nr:hypothetical protein GQ43DRAFT_472988 [Delitschia confertaspora ATCC 74209]
MGQNSYSHETSIGTRAAIITLHKEGHSWKEISETLKNVSASAAQTIYTGVALRADSEELREMLEYLDDSPHLGRSRRHSSLDNAIWVDQTVENSAWENQPLDSWIGQQPESVSAIITKNLNDQIRKLRRL